ncbi:hypothetical protein ACGFY6_12535 [Streptomyces sp. NPDC048387]|uniref:hypothetical protein n=1 Tax=Streptomyces sp. NPDC048387 TaxID=3365542 RepID=UPI00371B46E8
MTVSAGDAPLPLASTPERIRARAEERRLDVDETLDPVALAERAGVPPPVAVRGRERPHPRYREASAASFGRAASFLTIAGTLSAEPHAGVAR